MNFYPPMPFAYPSSQFSDQEDLLSSFSEKSQQKNYQVINMMDQGSQHSPLPSPTQRNYGQSSPNDHSIFKVINLSSSAQDDMVDQIDYIHQNMFRSETEEGDKLEPAEAVVESDAPSSIESPVSSDYVPSKELKEKSCSKSIQNKPESRAQQLKNPFPNVTKKIMKLVNDYVKKRSGKLFSDEETFKAFTDMVETIIQKPSKRAIQMELQNWLFSKRDMRELKILGRYFEKMGRQRYMIYSVIKGKEVDSAMYVGAKNREIIHFLDNLVHLLDRIIRSNGQ